MRNRCDYLLKMMHLTVDRFGRPNSQIAASMLRSVRPVITILWFIVGGCLATSTGTIAQETGAGVIAFCEETGSVGIGYAGNKMAPGVPRELVVAENLSEATEAAIGNCLAAGGLHGCCVSSKATMVTQGYTEELRCLSGATVKIGHPPLEELGGATSIWGIRFGHGATGASAASMGMSNCLRSVEGGGVGSRHIRVMSIGQVEVTVEEACSVGATVCLK